MIANIFKEVQEEARDGLILLKDDGYDIPVRMCFSVGESRESVPNFVINNIDKFNKLLTEYVYCALEFYNSKPTKDNIKALLTYVWANVTSEEMKCIEDYLERRIAFFNNYIPREKICKQCDLGMITGNVDVQSVLQETPYCFKASLTNGNEVYALPRISFGIADGVCYIYAIQNKDSKQNTNNQEYNELVHRTMRSINSGVKKYRNVTPSFVVAIAFFVSYLKSIGIESIEVLSPLPLRLDNKKRVNNYIVEHKTMRGNLDPESVEILKRELEEKRIMDVHNATVKFRDCFNRLKIHFSGIHLEHNTMTNEMVLDVVELSTSHPFLQQIVADIPYNVLK